MVADLRPALKSFLLADPAVSTKVGGIRVYHGTMPQGEAGDSLVINDRISEDTDYHNEGPSGMTRNRVQIDAWSRNASNARALDNAVKDRLSGFQGQMFSVRVQAALAAGVHSGFDSASGMHRSGRDFLITFEEL
jgi:hypothetical protein